MTRWTTYTITGQSQTPGQGGQPLSINLVSDSEGRAGGFTNANPQGIFVAHFDGHTWTRVAGPLASDPTDIRWITMLSPEEGWAGGNLEIDPPVGVAPLRPWSVADDPVPLQRFHRKDRHGLANGGLSSGRRRLHVRSTPLRERPLDTI